MRIRHPLVPEILIFFRRFDLLAHQTVILWIILSGASLRGMSIDTPLTPIGVPNFKDHLCVQVLGQGDSLRPARGSCPAWRTLWRLAAIFLNKSVCLYIIKIPTKFYLSISIISDLIVKKREITFFVAIPHSPYVYWTIPQKKDFTVC